MLALLPATNLKLLHPHGELLAQQPGVKRLVMKNIPVSRLQQWVIRLT